MYRFPLICSVESNLNQINQSRCFAVFIPIAAQSCLVWECDKWNLKNGKQKEN